MREPGYTYKPVHAKNNQIVHVDGKLKLGIICNKCHRVAIYSLEMFHFFGRPVKVKCLRNCSTTIILERRQYKRRTLKLMGLVSHLENRQKKYPVIIKSLSPKGLGFSRNHHLDFSIGDRFVIKIHLDNVNDTALYGNIVVRYHSDFYIGAEFRRLV